MLGHAFDAPGLLDESAGRHARRTSWRWSAGAGVARVGAQVVWNLVDGLHDGSPSERTVWIDGEPHEVGPQPFDGLDGVGDLRFTALATRAKHENYLLIAVRLRAAVRHVHRLAAGRRRARERPRA